MNTKPTPQDIVNQIIADLAQVPDDMDSATHFQFTTDKYINQELTSSLCSADTYDTVLTIDGEHWLLIDENNGYSTRFIGSGQLVYGWTNENVGQEALSESQRVDFQNELQSLLKGVEVVNRELTCLEKQWQEWFVDNLENAFSIALNKI